MSQPVVFPFPLSVPQRLIRSLVHSLVHSLKIGLVFCSLFISSAGLAAEQARSLELVFITSEHCPFCKAWERDVGQIYDSTPYALKARLRRVDLGDVDSALPAGAVKVFGTPTFLIVENNTEIGRIEGYQSSEMFFWALSEYISP
ncbi:thioredoxin family protein [Alphaproteobacteria bacterium]|nr:thioredoxin family protein [Alphaproteobacteria bacterium]